MFYFSYYIPTEDFEDDERDLDFEAKLLNQERPARNIKIIVFVTLFVYILLTYSVLDLNLWVIWLRRFSVWIAGSGFHLYPESIQNFSNSDYLIKLYYNSVESGYFVVSDFINVNFFWIYETALCKSLLKANVNFEEYLRASSSLFARFFDYFQIFNPSILKYWILVFSLWFFFFFWVLFKITQKNLLNNWLKEEPDDLFANTFSYRYSMYNRLKLTRLVFGYPDNYSVSLWDRKGQEWSWYFNNLELIKLRDSGLMLTGWYCIPAWVMLALTFAEFGTFFDDDYSFLLVQVAGEAEESFLFNLSHGWGGLYKTLQQLTLGDFESIVSPYSDLKGNRFSLGISKYKLDSETLSYEHLENRQLHRTDGFLISFYRFLEIYFFFVNSYLSNSSGSGFSFILNSDALFSDLFLQGSSSVENLFWWNSPNTQYYFSLVNNGFWPGLWNAFFDKDYFSVWAPLHYPWDFSWVLLNNVFVFLRNSNVHYSFFFSSDAFFYSYWHHWIGVHIEWSSSLIRDLDVKFNINDYEGSRLPLSTNKAVVLHLLQQYEVLEILTANFLNKKNNLTQIDKELINARLSFLEPEIGLSLKNFKLLNSRGLRAGQFAFQLQKNNLTILDQASELLYERLNRRKLAKLRFSSLGSWAWWEKYLSMRLKHYKTNKGYSGTHYYNHQIISKYSIDLEKNANFWAESTYVIYDKTNSFSNTVVFYFWLITGYLIPEKFYYYSLSLVNGRKKLVDFLMYYGVLFQPLKAKGGMGSVFGLGTNIDSYYATDFIDTYNYAGNRLNSELMPFYVKSYLKRNRLVPDSRAYVVQSADPLPLNLSSGVSLVNKVAHFMTDSTYGWDRHKSRVNTYNTLFARKYPALEIPDIITTPTALGFISNQDTPSNFYNPGKSPIKVFSSQLLLDRYHSIFGRGLGTYYFLLPGWWKTRWFNYFLTYYSLEYKLINKNVIDAHGLRLPDYYLLTSKKNSSHVVEGRYSEVEFQNYFVLLDSIDSTLFEVSQSDFQESAASSVYLNKIFYFGFVNAPSNFYLYTMLDVLYGCYEESSNRMEYQMSGDPYFVNTWSGGFDLLSVDLGVYLSYFGFLRSSVYDLNDHVLGFQKYSEFDDRFIWHKLVLNPWESFLFRLYGFYKNQIGLSYYYLNLSQDLENLTLGLDSALLPNGYSSWIGSSSLVNYLKNFTTDKSRFFAGSATPLSGDVPGFQDFSEISFRGLKLNGICFGDPSVQLSGFSGVPIFTQVEIDDFFRNTYDYKPLFLQEHVQLVARELYYWGNCWHFQSCGGLTDSNLGFLNLDFNTYQIKYNKKSKLFISSFLE